jgi:hypothetical protein
MLEIYSPKRQDSGSRHSLPRHLQLIWWVQVSILLCAHNGFHTNLIVSRITGISHLDDRTQCLYNSCKCSWH